MAIRVKILFDNKCDIVFTQLHALLKGRVDTAIVADT